ncbi:transforming growth factor beta activator LRRC33 [Fundulus heteroclitus]|uniref:transforming growth factor beta activator LRRC33 n=1 Tax=Fundulus heteroclitus TaxID=8078 RepID=UPI00165B6DDF|nr:transforming growth factor beta activator LRRC33 [Fundulus heteroclitus]XP_021178816.2 transforming growth factor beta activator LRRC33 [Fundulus heteroclitus]
MPVQGLTPILLCLLAMWRILTPVSSYPQHSPCQLVQKTAVCNNGKLSSMPELPPENLEELQLNYNQIKTLQDILQYPSLITISLACNGLEKVQPNVFQNSKSLENLNFANNNIHVGYEETSAALRKLHALRFLDLSENELNDEMAFSLLQNLSSLEYLNLSGNLLRRLDETSFRDLHNLKDLDLQRNRMFEIDSAFGSNPKLQRLNLAFNYLPCLTDFNMTQLVVLNASYNSIEWFISRQDLNETFQLETLDLSNNRLLFFPFLPSHSRLQNLYLSHNMLRFYEHFADNSTLQNSSVEFYNLKKHMKNVTAQLWDDNLHGDISSLDTLDLRGNQVDYFPDGFIKKMSSLSRLRMSMNCLETLNLTSEQFFGSLYELDISNNRLNQISADDGSLATLGNLTYFNLSRNNLEELPFGLFSSLPRIHSIDLSYNNIGICRPDEINTNVSILTPCLQWNKIESLRQLYLKGCNLETVPTSAFTGLSLTHLELSDNPGIDVQNSLQSLSGTLQHLGLGNTQIKDIDLSHFRSLKSLNLSRNSLSHITSSLHEIDLKVLDIRDNRLSTIPSGQAQSLASKLHTIFLTGNTFNCCQTEWFRTFERAKTVNMVGKSDIECQDGPTRTHKLLDSQSLSCSAPEESILWYILLLVPLCLFVTGISIVVFLTYKPKILQTSIKKKYLKPTSY